MTELPPTEVVVVGGGVAAVECALALRDLSPHHVTMIAPNHDFVARPLLIADPEAARVPLDELAADAGFALLSDAVASVDATRKRVLLRGGGTVPYDTLILAPGASVLPSFEGAIHLGDGTDAFARLKEEVRRGEVDRVAFVAPALTGWQLPLYEAALLTARLGALVTLVTPEPTPLAIFGDPAVAAALDAVGIEFVGGSQAGVRDGVVVAGWREIAADRIVSLPLLRGPHIPGVPEIGLYGLIPVDDHCRVEGLADAYAIGDATTYPIKQGGIACQQADVVAAHVAGTSHEPFTPVLAAVLLTGDGELSLGGGERKVPGRYLNGALPAAVARR